MSTQIGRAGEEAAAQYLGGLGYRVLERNFRFRLGEIDIIAEESNTVVFIEVKTRTRAGYGEAAEAVTVHKQRQLVRLAEIYLAGRGWSDRCCRFDVVIVTHAASGGWECQVIRDAFCA